MTDREDPAQRPTAPSQGSPTGRTVLPGPEPQYLTQRASSPAQGLVCGGQQVPKTVGVDLSGGADRTSLVMADFAEVEARIITLECLPGESLLDAMERLFPDGCPDCAIETVPTTSVLPDDVDWEPDSPSTPGDLIFATGAITYDRRGRVDRVELLEWEYDGAFFWIQEGVGLDYFVETADHGPVVLEENAVYVCEGLTVRYIRGDGWTTDDDEEWEDYTTRPATNEEIAGLFGCDFWNHDEGHA